MIEREIERFILNAHPRMSGRAVRLRALLPSEVDAVAKDAAKTSSSQAVEWRHAQLRIGVARCLLGITRVRVPTVMLPAPPGPDGVPKTRVAVGADGRPKRDADGNEVREPVLVPEPDQAWLADEKNWSVPNPIGLEQNYDEYIPNPKDDSWLAQWWLDTHECSGETVGRIMEKGQKVSSG